MDIRRVCMYIHTYVQPVPTYACTYIPCRHLLEQARAVHVLPPFGLERDRQGVPQVHQ